MLVFRSFARKIPKTVVAAKDPLTEEFEKYLSEEVAKGADEAKLKQQFVGNKSMEQLFKDLGTGKEINIDGLDLVFPSDLEQRLEKILEKKASEVQVGPTSKDLPMDILNRLNELKKK